MKQDFPKNLLLLQLGTHIIFLITDILETKQPVIPPTGYFFSHSNKSRIISYLKNVSCISPTSLNTCPVFQPKENPVGTVTVIQQNSLFHRVHEALGKALETEILYCACQELMNCTKLNKQGTMDLCLVLQGHIY